jgi:uncharacterized protein
MIKSFFVSDLHGKEERYLKLFTAIREQRPRLVFIGGDIFPHSMRNTTGIDTFLSGFLQQGLNRLRDEMRASFPGMYIIMGNDDARVWEEKIIEIAETGIWQYMHNRKIRFQNFDIYGYSYIPPSPFRLKDWERYDVSRYVEHGCIAPEEGICSVDIPLQELQHSTIKEDLDSLAGMADGSRSIFLFHTPPHATKLDRAALDGKMIDHAPVDVHVGSIAMRRFIEQRQPYLTLHGHIHESARITGSWKDSIGRTRMFSAAHDGKELALVRFDMEDLETAERMLV